jgi:hypothetical protein
LLIAGAMRLLLVSIAFAALTGCYRIGDAVVCAPSHHYDSCRAGERAVREDDERAEHARERRELEAHDVMLDERDAYRRAIAPCEAGDARACLTVAIYDDRHGAPDSQVEPRYRLACVSGVGRACYLAGAHERAHERRDLALASFEHGCELRDGESCYAGFELDGARIDLLQGACQQRFADACALYERRTDTSFLR